MTPETLRHLMRRPTPTPITPPPIARLTAPSPWEFTDADVAREARVLDQLADETAASDPLTAARKLFGGGR